MSYEVHADEVEDEPEPESAREIEPSLGLALHISKRFPGQREGEVMRPRPWLKPTKATSPTLLAASMARRVRPRPVRTGCVQGEAMACEYNCRRFGASKRRSPRCSTRSKPSFPKLNPAR